MPWLMKAEPDTRIVKGKDVKFSIDDLAEMGVSPWDGVRNHEAKNIMKEKMKLGDKVLFYHSNCKTPGVFGLAEIEKEGYPDSWDTSHPYFDAKSKEDAPTWYMVNVKFVRCLEHPVTLAFVKSLLGLSSPPAGIEYIGAKGLKGIQGMALVNRGRLSVQPVEEDAYDAIVALGEKGGWDEDAVGKKPAKAKAAKAPTSASKRKAEDSDGDDGAASTKKTTAKAEPKPKAEAKSKARPKPITEGTRRSSRKRT